MKVVPKENNAERKIENYSVIDFEERIEVDDISIR